MVINPVQCLIPGDQLQRCFFAYAPHPGDIVRSIAHESLHVNNLRRSNLIFFHYRLRRHGIHLRNALPGKKHGDMLIRKLESISVPGDNINRKALLIPSGQCPKDIIPFISFRLIYSNPHDPQYFLNQRKLRYQFVRCRLSRSLIPTVHLCAERFPALIKRYSHVLRIQCTVNAEKHPQKTKYCIGINAIFRQRWKRIKCPVKEAAPINDY